MDGRVDGWVDEQSQAVAASGWAGLSPFFGCHLVTEGYRDRAQSYRPDEEVPQVGKLTVCRVLHW